MICLLLTESEFTRASYKSGLLFTSPFPIEEKAVFADCMRKCFDFVVKEADLVVSDYPDRLLVIGLYLSFGTFLSG
jgi:hypothetical protein